ncbi:MAG: class I SAM-dependent methyltransferase [Methylacidiphilales bacterium]|nr:class I SAM-dependent methyltransferase [Candidatus Methylacidiphilales bacterium]
MAYRQQDKFERLTDVLWRQGYFSRFGENSSERLYVQTNHPLAYASDDHRLPRGAINDNSRNPRFNSRLYAFLGYPRKIRLMDLGCAGGGFVRSMLEDGHQAIGLEGSDGARRALLGEWGNIPRHLFTGDITKDFTVVDAAAQPVSFDVITAWEVLEHIAEEDIDGLLQRIARKLRPEGYFICSIDLLPDGNPLTGAVYHKTLRPAAWWRDKFQGQGFTICTNHGFAMEDFVRGNGSSLKDWVPDERTGIHIVAKVKTSAEK